MNSVAQLEAALAALKRVMNEAGLNTQQAGETFSNFTKILSQNAKPLDNEMTIEYESPKTRDEFRVELPHFDTSIPDFTETLTPKVSIESFEQPV